jgi:UDP-glucose 4-epimerase
MRIVLTGGSGFIGGVCLRVAIRSGHEMLALSRRPSAALPDGTATWVAADLNDVSSYDAALAAFRPDAAIHLAWEGIPDYSLENSLRNVASGVRFAERAFAAGCRRFVAGGSCWEYGALVGRIPECAEPRQVGIFGACKTAQREVMTALADAAGATLAWARIFYAYGPGQKAISLAPSLCADLLAGRAPRPRTPHAVNDFIYVDDVAEALITLAGSEIPGIFNVGSGAGMRVADFAAEFARAAGMDMPVPPVDSVAPSAGPVADIERLKALAWTPRTPPPAGIALTWSRFLPESDSPC